MVPWFRASDIISDTEKLWMFLMGLNFRNNTMINCNNYLSTIRNYGPRSMIICDLCFAIHVEL